MEHVKQLARWLMNRAHNCCTASGQQLQRSHQLLSAVRIQTGRWLIAEQQRRSGQQFGGESQTLSFATRHPFAARLCLSATDARVGA